MGNFKNNYRVNIFDGLAEILAHAFGLIVSTMYLSSSLFSP